MCDADWKTVRATAFDGAPVLGPPAVQKVMELAWGMWASGVIQAAAKLRIADSVGDEPVRVDRLAEAIGADPSALSRLMRALSAYGVYRQLEPGLYEHTEASRAMRSDAPVRVGDVMLTGSYWGWQMWAKLDESVRTGECAFRATYGKDLFSYFAEDDNEAGAATLRGYAAQSVALHPALVGALDLSRVGTVVDVGGGHGSLLCALLEANPALRGILFDRAHTIEHADPVLSTGALADRCELEAGDCLVTVPKADVYLFRQVLHMWEDDMCVQALSNVAKVAEPGGRVIVLEQLISDPPANPWDALMDLHMLLVMDGRERTTYEYAELFERAGLRYRGTTETGTPLRLIEATVGE
ncbi:methyltransferase [Amycolatopsis japonica]